MEYKYRGKEEKAENIEQRKSGKFGASEVDSEVENRVKISEIGFRSEWFFENKKASEQKTSPEDVRWLTTCEAAQYLRVSVSSIKAMIYRGRVRPYKLGRHNRFRRDELDLLIRLPVFNQEV